MAPPPAPGREYDPGALLRIECSKDSGSTAKAAETGRRGETPPLVRCAARSMHAIVRTPRLSNVPSGRGGLHLNHSVGCVRRPRTISCGPSELSVACRERSHDAVATRLASPRNKTSRNRRAKPHFGPLAHLCGPRRCIPIDSTASSSAERRWEGRRPSQCQLPQYQQRVQRRSGRRRSTFRRSEPPDGRS
jgi:hypothetical protein